MADFESHKNQVERNLEFLEIANYCHNKGWDWQVTIAFYAAVHLINAHLARSMGMHYRTHKDVEEAIDFGNSTSLGRLPEDTFVRYRSLLNLSRRSRYLIHEDDGPLNDNQAFMTRDKHFSRAIRHLDEILDFMNRTYGTRYSIRKIRCIELRIGELKNFEIVH